MPLRLGHRGAPRLVEGEAQAYVENTLEAFRQALEAGLDGFELDVHLTRDGVLVVHHDFTLGGIPINGVSSRELPAYVPTLEEVLRTFPGAWINVELKSLPPETDGREEALARLLARYPSDRIWVSSFDPLALVRLRRLGVGPLGLLYQHEEAEALAPLPGGGVGASRGLSAHRGQGEGAKGPLPGTGLDGEPPPASPGIGRLGGGCPGHRFPGGPRIMGGLWRT